MIAELFQIIGDDIYQSFLLICCLLLNWRTALQIKCLSSKKNWTPENRGPWFNRAKRVIRIEEFVNYILFCSLNSAPAEILSRCPILFPCLSLDSKAGSCPFHSLNSQISNLILNSYRCLPLPPKQVHFSSFSGQSWKWACAYKDLSLAAYVPTLT